MYEKWSWLVFSSKNRCFCTHLCLPLFCVICGWAGDVDAHLHITSAINRAASFISVKGQWNTWLHILLECIACLALGRVQSCSRLGFSLCCFIVMTGTHVLCTFIWPKCHRGSTSRQLASTRLLSLLLAHVHRQSRKHLQHCTNIPT